MRPEPIKAIGAREARTRRACERWVEANDPKGTPLELLAERATTSADALGRDLTPHEVNTVCSSAVAAFVASEEQRLAAEALSDAREQERLAYLARVRRDVLLTADERVVPARGKRGPT